LTAVTAAILPPARGCPRVVCHPISTIIGATTKSVFDGFVVWVAQAASWLVLHLITLVVNGTTTPNPTIGWFETNYRSMLTVGMYFMLPMLMVATIGAVIRQDIARLGKAWCVHLPLAVIGGMCAISITSWALVVTDSLCRTVISTMQKDLPISMETLAAAIVSMAAGPANLVAGLVAFLAILGGLALWCELLLRSAAVYVALVFMPIALAGLVWPATAHWARRLIETLVALILSKFVIVVVLSLAVAAISSGPTLSASAPDSVLSGGVMLLLAAFAPFSLLKLIPIVEAGAIAHMEGMARRPGRAVQSAAAGWQSPTVQAAMAAMSQGGASEGEEGAEPASPPTLDIKGGDLERAEADLAESRSASPPGGPGGTDAGDSRSGSGGTVAENSSGASPGPAPGARASGAGASGAERGSKSLGSLLAAPGGAGDA